MARAKYATSADGTEIAYRESGSGPPLVFVHGSATSGADWVFVAPALRKRFTLVMVDRRGRGRSADGPKYAIEREAEDILAVLEATGAEMLVGHSYGALCSMLAAARTDRLRRLVLYEPPVAVQEAGLDQIDALVAAGDHDTALATFLGAAGATPAELDAVRNSPAWPVLLGAVPPLPRELHAAAVWQWPGERIEAKTLFLLGGETDSPAYLSGLDALKRVFADVRREEIPGQRHLAHVVDGRAFARTVAEFCA